MEKHESKARNKIRLPLSPLRLNTVLEISANAVSQEKTIGTKKWKISKTISMYRYSTWKTQQNQHYNKEIIKEFLKIAENKANIQKSTVNC